MIWVVGGKICPCLKSLLITIFPSESLFNKIGYKKEKAAIYLNLAQYSKKTKRSQENGFI